MKVVSVALTIAFGAGAIAIGAGAPLSPGRIAKVTGDATRNLEEAQRNIRGAVESTEALARIERNVSSQLETSRRLLATQLGIEDSSKRGVELSRKLVGHIADVGGELDALVDRLERVASLSRDVSAQAEASDAAAVSLEETLDHLIERYRVAVRESRELNKKARAFEEIRP